jgi:ribosomal protein S8
MPKYKCNDNQPAGDGKMNVQKRQKIERKIVRAILTKAKKEGYIISLDNGEEIIKLSPLNSIKAMLEQCFSVDEEHIMLKKDGHKKYIFLVYGNTGHDVICDYSTSLDEFISPIEDMCEKICLES